MKGRLRDGREDYPSASLNYFRLVFSNEQVMEEIEEMEERLLDTSLSHFHP